MTTLRTTLNPFNRRPPVQLYWLLVAVVLVAVLAIGGMLALRVLRPDAPAQIVPGQTLAQDIALAASHAPGVQITSGAYVPGDTLLLYSRIDQPDRTLVRAWARTQLEPFAARLATMANNETLKWVIDFGPAPVEQEVLIAPLDRAANPLLYRYISAAPALFSVTNALPTVATTSVTLSIPAAPVNGAPTSVPGLAIILHNLPFIATGDVSKDWLPLAGDWAADASVYSQRQPSGYDFISMLALAPQTHYSLEARLRLVEGEMGGGFIYNAPSQTARAGAQVLDMDKQGSFLRWGRYDANGKYIYEGGMPLTPPLNDGQWHTLRLITHASTSRVWVDGRTMSNITNTSTSGYLGLTTSNAHVDFDNVNVSALASGAVFTTLPLTTSLMSTVTSPITSIVAPLANFNDDFADGNANGWRVLNGTWQVVEQEYQQTGTDGFDLGSISAFQGEVYTVSVRLRWIDGSMGAGLYFNMAQRDAKMNSQMISYTRKGRAVQWGHFDEGGNFVFDGSAAVANGGDGRWHTLMVVSRVGQADFLLDDKLIAKDVTLAYQGGYVGLLTSASKVAFDDIKIATP